MVNVATVTGYTANGKLVTALVLNDVHQFLVDNENSVIRITYGEPYVTITFAYDPATMDITITTASTGTTYLVA